MVLSIFTIMTGVVLANLPQFRERTALQLVAQKMSVTVREAQVYGVGVKSSSDSGVDVFPSHGIYFDPVASNNKSYVLFADKLTANDRYDVGTGSCGSATTECVTKYDLTGTVEIDTLTLCQSANCSSSINVTGDGLNIVFDRPKTEANFTNLSGGSLSASYARIIIKSSRSGEQRFIDVWNTGQISIKTP